MLSDHSSNKKRPHMGPTGDNGDEQCRPVCVRFTSRRGRPLCQPDPQVSGNARPIWDESPLLLKRADGTYELMGLSSNMEGVARWVLSFAGDAEVESPEALRRRVRCAARRVTALHSVVDTDP